LLAFVRREEHTDTVTGLLEQWKVDGVVLHSPLIAQYEIATVLTRDRRGGASSEDIDEALGLIAGLRVRYHPMADIARAIEIAVELGRSDAYDTPFLALAERLDTELWTLDGPLARNAGPRGYSVKLID
jgi:predicted nucleic acid-binding protein